MTRESRIEDAVARNRGSARKLETYEVEAGGDPLQEYNFDGSVVEVGVTAEVYTRPINSTLVFGHPSSAHGFGRGDFGDRRGSWTSQETVSSSSGEFTRLGREAVADALQGALRGVGSAVVGSGTAAPSVSDSSLAAEEGSAPAWATKDANNETRAVGTFLFSGFGDAVNEMGIEADNDDLIARLTASGVNPTAEQEARVDVTMTFVGNGVASGVVTDNGETAIADSIESFGSVVGIEAVAIGTGTAQEAESDTSLANELDRKNALHDRRPEQVRAYTKWYGGEVSGTPHSVSEMGLFDNSGRLVFRIVFDPFTLTDESDPSVGASIRVL